MGENDFKIKKHMTQGTDFGVLFSFCFASVLLKKFHNKYVPSEL